MKKKLERNRATEKLIESQITSLDNLYIYFVEKLDENLTNEQEIQKRKELEDNEIIQQKEINENNHDDVQTCNITINDYVKGLDSFLNAYITYKNKFLLPIFT